MKNIIYHKNAITRFTAIYLLVVIFFWGCKDEYLELKTTDDVNMTTYFRQNPERFSEFLKVLEITGTAGYLGAYGAYTVFAPTNEAMNEYAQENGVSSVEQMEVEKLKDLVKFHLIEDVVSTSTFTDGKLPRITMYGQYIITGAENINGVSKIRINRQANILEGDIMVGNGIIHAIDDVLKPATKTVAQLIEENPHYSIFTSALKETGLYEPLNVNFHDEPIEERNWYTVLAHKNEVYNKIGINNFEALKQKYSNTGDPTNPDDSLYLYVAYHILPDIKYVADIVTSPSHETMAPLEVVTSKLRGDTVLLNEAVFNGVVEKGVKIDRDSSDYTATNGVLHSVEENIEIKIRKPTRLYFDLADQPELRVMPEWRKVGAPAVHLRTDQLQDVVLDGGSNKYWDFAYVPSGAGERNTRAFNDHLSIYLRPAVVKSVEFTTPVIVKGKYKVWIAYRRVGTTVQALFNGEPLPRTVNLGEYFPSGVNEGELLAQGWKRYTTEPTGHSQARLFGTVDVKTTGRHKIKLVALVNIKASAQLDMIQFIPADENQLWPKISADGTLVYE